MKNNINLSELILTELKEVVIVANLLIERKEHSKNKLKHISYEK